MPCSTSGEAPRPALRGSMPLSVPHVTARMRARQTGRGSMRQHATQNTDEDDEHGRTNPRPMSIGFRTLSASPTDQQVDRQRSATAKSLVAQIHVMTGISGRPPTRSCRIARISTAKASTPACGTPASFNPIPASSAWSDGHADDPEPPCVSSARPARRNSGSLRDQPRPNSLIAVRRRGP